MPASMLAIAIDKGSRPVDHSVDEFPAQFLVGIVQVDEVAEPIDRAALIEEARKHPMDRTGEQTGPRRRDNRPLPGDSARRRLLRTAAAS